MPFKDREIDARTFLEDADATRAGREKFFQAALADQLDAPALPNCSRKNPTACLHASLAAAAS